MGFSYSARPLPSNGLIQQTVQIVARFAQTIQPDRLGEPGVLTVSRPQPPYRARQANEQDDCPLHEGDKEHGHALTHPVLRFGVVAVTVLPEHVQSPGREQDSSSCQQCPGGGWLAALLRGKPCQEQVRPDDQGHDEHIAQSQGGCTGATQDCLDRRREQADRNSQPRNQT